MNKALSNVIQAVAVRTLTAIERVRTGVAFNPLAPQFRNDPYPIYKQLRERDPIHRSLLLRGAVVTRFRDIETILKDARFSADERKLPNYEKNRKQMVKSGVLREDEVDDRGSMLRMDPPDHSRLRSLVSRAFTPRTVEGLRPRIEEIVDEQVSRAAKSGGMEVIGELAYPLPVTVIAEMLGIPPEDRDRFKHWSDEAIRTLGFSSIDDAKRSMQAQRDLRAYLEPVVEQRRREPREDLISGLVAAEEQGDKLSTDEVFATIILLLVAGNETTTNLIGNGLLALLRHPDQLRLLREDPALIEGAIEELLRYDSPVQFTSRHPHEDIELDGRVLRANEEAALILGSANRDPDEYAEPDRLDITRTGVRHLSFSHGMHFCLGAPLARLEGQIALAALARNFPEMRIAGPIERGDNLLLRGVTTLPIAV